MHLEFDSDDIQIGGQSTNDLSGMFCAQGTRERDKGGSGLTRQVNPIPCLVFIAPVNR